ncbi:hypothetical protein, partial [Haloquadratum walsbyi]
TSESITVGSDPDLTVSVSTNGSEKLTTVCVTVDNKTKRTYNNSASNQTLTRELGITLQNGAHTIEVETTTQTNPDTTERTPRNNTSTKLLI